MGFSADDLKVVAQRVEVQHVSADNYTVNWPQLWNVLKGPVDEMLAGRAPGKQTLTEVAPAAETAIKALIPT